MMAFVKPTSTSQRLEDDCMSLSTDEASDDEDGGDDGDESAETNHGVKLDTIVHNKTLLHTDRWVKLYFASVMQMVGVRFQNSCLHVCYN